MQLLIPLIIFIFIILWVVSLYNFFVSSKARIKAAIQEIGNQLKRQAELIPNLESSVKGYMKHETQIFKMLTDARKAITEASKSGDIQKMSEAGEKLSAVLPRLSVAVESNPQMQASQIVSDLMSELRDTSDKVMYARRLVIDLTADYNVKRVSFPSNLIASMFSFNELPGLITPETGSHMEVSEDETKTPKVSL